MSWRDDIAPAGGTAFPTIVVECVAPAVDGGRYPAKRGPSFAAAVGAVWPANRQDGMYFDVRGHAKDRLHLVLTALPQRRQHAAEALRMDRQQEINLAIYRAFDDQEIAFAFPTRTLHGVGAEVGTPG